VWFLAGRLEDKSANVRKAALQLLATLLLNNPFGPQLPADKFTVSLEEHKQRLKVWLVAGHRSLT
jgi:condensin complex subunit 1